MNPNAAELLRLVETIRNAAKALSLSLRNHAPPFGISTCPAYAIAFSPACQFIDMATIPPLPRVQFRVEETIAFQAAAYDIFSVSTFERESLFESLRVYGTPLVQFMLSELGKRNISRERFDELTEGLFDYYKNDAVTTREIDAAIAELEPGFDLSPKKDETFRHENALGKEYLRAELEALRGQLSAFLGQ